MHYNNLVVNVWLKVEVGGHTHTTVSLLYTRKRNQGKYFLSGKNQGIFREFHFWIAVATLR